MIWYRYTLILFPLESPHCCCDTITDSHDYNERSDVFYRESLSPRVGCQNEHTPQFIYSAYIGRGTTKTTPHPSSVTPNFPRAVHLNFKICSLYTIVQWRACPAWEKEVRSVSGIASWTNGRQQYRGLCRMYRRIITIHLGLSAPTPRTDSR